MDHQWLPATIPPAALALAAALAGVLVGVVLWLGAARYSRGLITLSAVALGTVVGKELPAWCGWSIDGMGPAIAGAILLGVAAFALHRAWVGLGLGLMLAAWAALGVWLFVPEMGKWTVPAIASGTLSTWAGDLWASFPPKAHTILPFACGAGLLSGWCCTIRWPRVAVALLYSLLGVSLLAVMGTHAVELVRPQWKTWIPAETWAQGLILIGLAAFGALVQWRFTPAMAKRTPRPKRDAEPRHDGD